MGEIGKEGEQSYLNSSLQPGNLDRVHVMCLAQGLTLNNV